MTEENLNKDTKINLLNKLIEKTKTNDQLPFYTPENLFVPGVGPTNADIMVIGEAPGREESLLGKPFVGRSGKLLSKLLEEEGLDRSSLWVTNVVKYRPPNNQTPTYPESIAWASAYLRQEIQIICPKIILTLGSCATKIFLGEKISITNIHGKIFKMGNAQLIPMYHPAYLLRNPAAINTVRNALKIAKQIHTEIVHNYVDNLLITCA